MLKKGKKALPRRRAPVTKQGATPFLKTWTNPSSALQNNNKNLLSNKKHIAGIVITSLAGIALLATFTTAGFTAILSTLVALCALVSYDIIGRRRWEKIMGTQVNTVSEQHDRLVREVARNRSDVSLLKDGLTNTALAIEAQGKRLLSGASSPEARMIETIASNLGTFENKPLRPSQQIAYDKNIMALELAPPPHKAPPLNPMDEDINTKIKNISTAKMVNLIRLALRENRIEPFLQPIVSLPQRQTKMYEIYTRLRAEGGYFLPAAHYLALAKKEALLPAIDNMILLRCLEMLRDKRSSLGESTYILNISCTTLSDSGFMNELVTFLARNKSVARQLIFELPQKDIEIIDDTALSLLDGLNKLGVRFSIDHIHKKEIDINLLKNCHIRFVKMNGQWLIREAAINGGIARINRLKKQLTAAGIDLIVEKIEDENMLRELLDFDIDYGQGWLFGKPDHQYAYRKMKMAA